MVTTAPPRLVGERIAIDAAPTECPSAGREPAEPSGVGQGDPLP
jgi:hypothetical protein